jgi:hypothetical protein
VRIDGTLSVLTDVTPASPGVADALVGAGAPIDPPQSWDQPTTRGNSWGLLQWLTPRSGPPFGSFGNLPDLFGEPLFKPLSPRDQGCSVVSSAAACGGDTHRQPGVAENASPEPRAGL